MNVLEIGKLLALALGVSACASEEIPPDEPDSEAAAPRIEKHALGCCGPIEAVPLDELERVAVERSVACILTEVSLRQTRAQSAIDAVRNVPGVEARFPATVSSGDEVVELLGHARRVLGVAQLLQQHDAWFPGEAVPDLEWLQGSDVGAWRTAAMLVDPSRWFDCAMGRGVVGSGPLEPEVFVADGGRDGILVVASEEGRALAASYRTTRRAGSEESEPEWSDPAARTARAIELGEAFVAQRDRYTFERTDTDRSNEQLLNLHRTAAFSIRQELERTDAPAWAGSYSSGAGLGGFSAWIAPGAGATFCQWSDMGLRSPRTVAVVAADAHRIVLEVPAKNQVTWMSSRWDDYGPTYPLLSDEWFLVTWNDLELLLPSTQMIPFCSRVHRRKGSIWPYLARTVDGDTSAPTPLLRIEELLEQGSPWIPEEYRPFLPDAPIDGTVIHVEERRAVSALLGDGLVHTVRATVDVGVASGLLPGMVVDAVDSPRLVRGEVVESRACDATVEFRFAGPDEDFDPVPQVGWRVSTRATDADD